MRLLILFFAFFSFFSAEAQKVLWSTPLSESKLSIVKIAGQDENGFYLIRSNHRITDNEFFTYRNNRFSVSYFDYDLRLRWEKDADMLKKDVRIIGYKVINNSLVEISAERNKTEKKFRLLGRSYHENGRVDTSYKTILEVPLVGSPDFESSFFLAQSQNKIFTVIAFQEESPEFELHYRTLVCDTSLNIVRNNTLAVPGSRKNYNPYKYLVSNKGDIFLFGIKTDPEKRSRDADKSFFTVFSSTAESNRWNEHQVRNPEHFLTDAGFAFDELNQKIVITGFYSDKTEYSSAGVFYYNLDPATLAASEIHFSAFAPSFLYKFLGEQKANYNRELVNYSIDKIILRRDGGAVIIAEANYTSEYSYYDYYLRTYMSRTYYHRDNIIQLSVNKDGSILWSNVVQKEQTADDSDDTFFSYTSAIAGGKIQCVYNRFLKRRTPIIQVSTDALGNEKSATLFEEDQDVYIMPSASRQVDESMLVVPAYKGKQLYLAGIIF
jgi:hypothetical protein